MSEIKGPVNYEQDGEGVWIFTDANGCYLFIVKTLDLDKVHAIRDALTAQARHAEAVRLLREMITIPAVLSVLGRNHVGNCMCPLCKSQAYLEAEKGESNANS